jgi:peptidyl-prolyl cis-trans isomerase SurA
VAIKNYPFFVLLMMSLPLQAAETSIAALVNDEAITNADITARVGLITMNTGAEKDPAALKAARERVLKNLIDETLQLQEAKQRDIAVEKEEIDKAFASMAKQNQMNAEQLEEMMKERGIPKETLIQQIRAGLSWSKVVQRILRAQIEIGDDEINAALERMKANEGKPEALMSEIFLSVENPADESKVRDLADSLVTRMKQGANFSSIAQQFSQGTGAINGGDLGWVQQGQLTGELDQAVRKLEVGQISLPIRTPEGFHILGKRDQRTISAVDPKSIQVHLKQASLALKDRTLEQAKPDIEKFRETIANCGALADLSAASRRSELAVELTQRFTLAARMALGGFVFHRHQALLSGAIEAQRIEQRWGLGQAGRERRPGDRSRQFDQRGQGLVADGNEPCERGLGGPREGLFADDLEPQRDRGLTIAALLCRDAFKFFQYPAAG